MLGGELIINDNERLNLTADGSLEGTNEFALTMHGQEQELKPSLSARSFHCARGNICAGVRFVPEDGHSGNAGESLFEQRKPLSTVRPIS